MFNNLETDRLKKSENVKSNISSSRNSVISTPILQNTNAEISSGTINQGDNKTSQNLFSDTVLPSISKGVTNVFETAIIPSASAYNIAKSIGGSMLENQKAIIRENANKILNDIGLGANYINQKMGSGITRGWGTTVGGAVDFLSGLGDIGGEILTKADTKLVQGLDKIFGKDSGYEQTEAQRIEGVKQIGKKARELPEMFNKAQEYHWEDMPEVGGVTGWAGDVAEQVGQMEAPILSSMLLGGGKGTMIATMFPMMYEESYDRLSQIEGATDEQIVLTAGISALVKSIIEVFFGLENVLTGGKSKAFSKLLEKPILNFVKQTGVGTAGETFEETLQAITDDIGAYLLGEESEYETLWDMLFSGDYWKEKWSETILPTARVTRPLVGISTHYGITAEKSKKKAIDKTLEDYDKWISEGLDRYSKGLETDIEETMDAVFRRDDAYINLARLEDSYDEFVEDAKQLDENISDEYLKSIWDYTNRNSLDISLDNITKELNDFKQKIESEYIEDEDIDKDVKEEELAYKSPEYYEYKWKNTKTEREKLIDNTIEELTNLKKRIESEYIENEDIEQDIREEELAYKSPEYYEYKWRNTKTGKEKLIDNFIEELNNLKKDIESEYIENEVGEDTEEELAYKSPEYYEYKRRNAKTEEEKLVDTITRYLNQLKTDIESEYIENEDIDQDIKEEELAYKNSEYYDYKQQQEDIPEIEDNGNYEAVVDNEIQQNIDENVDYLMEFSNQMKEQFDRELAQDTNKTVKELKEKSQQTIADIKITNLVNETNDTLQDLATEINIENLDENGLKDNRPKFVFGRYQKPAVLDGELEGKKGEGISSEATRKETEREYYKTQDQLDTARRQANALSALIRRFNNSLNKSQTATQEDIDAVENAMGGKLIGKEILLRDLKDGRLVDAIFKAYHMVDTWGNTIKKLKEKANREAWKYIYRLNAESKDNDLIGFSTFVLKHKLKTRPTDARHKKMIKNALYKMSELFNLDMAKVFEGCNIIFLDYGGSSKKNAWGTMEGFIDGSGTPVIPISLNYMGWKESTVIHELIHGLDFVYQYRNGGVSFIKNDSLFYSGNFLFTLNRSFPELYKKLVYEMTPGDGKKIGYWTKPTEVMSRIFQEYYEYYALDQKNTTEDRYHWKDITLVKNAVNKLTDLFREEFGMSPILNGNETIEEYNEKINKSVEQFNSDDTWQFVEMINEVGTKMKLLRLKTEITTETEGNKGEDYLNNLISLAEYEFQWGMLMTQGQNYTDVLLGTKEGIYQTFGPDRDYAETVKKEIQDTMKDIEEGNYVSISKETKKNISKEEAKEKAKEVFKQIGKVYKFVFKDITDRLKEISPELAGSLVRMQSQTGIKASIYNHNVKDFIDKYGDLSKKDQEVLHKLLFNYIEDINKDKNIQKGLLLDFAKKHGIKKELEDVFGVLASIKDEYKASGLRLTERELYFPRTVKNYKGLIKYLNKKAEEGKGDIDYKFKKELIEDLDGIVKNDKLSDMEKNRRTRNILEELSGRFSPKRVASDSQHQRQREITTTDDWGDEILEYYDRPDVSLAKYIANMTSNIEQAKFFARGIGTEALEEIYDYITRQRVKLTDNMKDIVSDYMNGADVKLIINRMLEEIQSNNLLTLDDVVETTSDILSTIRDIYGAETEQSITALVNKGVREGTISADKLEEVKSILNSYFSRRSTPAIAQLIKNFGYLFNLTQHTSTIRQFGDIAFSALKDPTLFKSVLNTILKRSGVTVDTLGIEDLYEDLKQDRKNLTTWLLENELRFSGFKWADMSMKNLFLNSALVNMNRLANNEKKSGALKKRLTTIWGDRVGKEVFEIYKGGVLPQTENGKLDIYKAMNVLVDLAYQLGECQPIYRGNMTQLYLDVPRIRPLYGLRTFTLKLYNLIVNGTKQIFKNSREMGDNVATASLKAGWFAGTVLVVTSLFDTIAQEIIDLYLSLFYAMAGNENKRWEGSLIYQLMHNGPREAMHKLWRNMIDTGKSTLFMGDVAESKFKREGLESFFDFAPPAVGFFNDLLGSLNWTIDMIAGTEAVWDIWHPVKALEGEKEKGLVKNPVLLVRYIPFIGKGLYEGLDLKNYASQNKRPRTKNERQKRHENDNKKSKDDGTWLG